MITLSSNGFSHDMQVDDVLTHMRGNVPEHVYKNLLHKFPELDDRVLDGASFDTEVMGVDIEWASWVTDAIEEESWDEEGVEMNVEWWEGEPVIMEDGDRDDDDMEGEDIISAMLDILKPGDEPKLYPQVMNNDDMEDDSE